MSRIRTIKPEFFKHEELFEAENVCGLPLRVAFAGLWCAADREGRFRWRPRALKLDCLPYDNVDFATVLDALCKTGFVAKYAVNGEAFGCIPSWHKHQQINVREQASKLPPPSEDTLQSMCMHRIETMQVLDLYPGEGEGERKGRELHSGSKDPSFHAHAHAHAPAKEATARSKGTRLPSDWEPSQEVGDWADRQLGAEKSQLEFDKFCDYWEARAGREAVKLDWNKTFKNWVRTAKERNKPNGAY